MFCSGPLPLSEPALSLCEDSPPAGSYRTLTSNKLVAGIKKQNTKTVFIAASHSTKLLVLDSGGF